MTENKHNIQFLSIGHFTHDVTEDGLILGGAAAYSSATARKLGLHAGVVSAVGKNFLHYDKLSNISLALVGKPDETTTFQNIYENGVRRQVIKGVSAPICSEHVPEEWLNADIVYLCPVANEVDSSLARRFSRSIIGVSPQGWMRQWDNDGNVSPRKWTDAPNVLPFVDVLIMSEEDITPFPEVVQEYVELVDAMVLTRGERGSTLYYNNQVIDFPAFRVNVTDPTGAGDVFAAAFLINLRQTHDLYKASVFANCAASFVVEKHGTEGIPGLSLVYSRIESYKQGN